MHNHVAFSVLYVNTRVLAHVIGQFEAAELSVLHKLQYTFGGIFPRIKHLIYSTHGIMINMVKYTVQLSNDIIFF